MYMLSYEQKIMANKDRKTKNEESSTNMHVYSEKAFTLSSTLRKRKIKKHMQIQRERI